MIRYFEVFYYSEVFSNERVNVVELEALVSELKILIYFIVIIDAQIAHSGPEIEPLSDHIFSTQSDV